MFRIPPRLELVQEQPADRKVWKLPCGQFLEAVVWGDQDKACHGAQACQVNRNSTAQATAYNGDVLVVSADPVEQSQGVSEERGFGRLARTSPVTPVVQQVDGMIRKRS